LGGGKGKFAGLQRPFARLQREFAGLQRQFVSLQRGFAGLQRQFVRLQRQFAGLQREFVRLQRDFAGQQNAFANRSNGRNGVVKTANGREKGAEAGSNGKTCGRSSCELN